ncbi:MAG: insulinase family protein [Clostridia bacterium]|nr:insulinase family protein [Clostridia bacterium]
MNPYKLKNNINLYHIKSENFKTVTVSLNIYRPICDNASALALLGGVLESGCCKYPSKAVLAKHLEWLYGASLQTAIMKKEETQILSVIASAPAEKFTGEDTLKELSELIYEVVYNPLLENGAFKTSIVNIEKESLKNLINSVVNEKRDYADKRALEEMCGSQPFAIYKYGSAEGVDALDAATLTEYYNKIIKESKIDIFVSAGEDISSVKNVFDSCVSNGTIQKAEKSPAKTEMKTVHENMDVAQGKLVIGFTISSDDYFGNMLFNSVYGSGTHSKLFNNVREKLSLAYYAYSRLTAQKGVIFASAGIEFDKYDMAKDEIFAQLKAVQNGEVSDSELEAAKKSIINIIKSLNDNPVSLMDYYTGLIVAGREVDTDKIIDGINAVTKEDVVRASKTVVPDTLYFLKGLE